MSYVEERMLEKGIVLPPVPEPIANYLRLQRTGNLIFVAGSGPSDDEGFEGKVGIELSEQDGYRAARSAALNVLSKLKAELGDLDRVAKIVKMIGFVASGAEFYDQPRVVDGASDLFVEVFGEAGRHARTAISVVALPGNIPVELVVVAEVK